MRHGKHSLHSSIGSWNCLMQFLFLPCRCDRAKRAHRNPVGALASLLPTPSQKFFRPLHTLLSSHTTSCQVSDCTFFSLCACPAMTLPDASPGMNAVFCTMRNAAFLRTQRRYGRYARSNKACYFHFVHEFSCVRAHVSVPFVVCSYEPLNCFGQAQLVLA